MDAKGFKALAKKIGFPGLAEFRAGDWAAMSVGWNKRGGHVGGRTIGRVVKKAEALGFVKVDERDGWSPDGNVVTMGRAWSKKVGDHTVFLHACSKYGVTKHDNWFEMSLFGAIEEPST